MTSAPVQMVLDKLPSAKPAGNGKWTAFCPVHEADGNGHKPSLSIGQGDDGRALLDCKAGCATSDVVQALGLTMADLFPDRPKANAPRAATRRIVKTYDYLDEIGTLVYQSVRYDPKDFRQRRPDGNGGWVWNLNGVPRILYRLPELLAANPAAWVFVNEGEKDADNVAALGLVATTNPGGAGKWKHLADDSALHGRRVCIVADKDDKGRKHAKDVAARLCGKAADVRIVELPDVAGATVKDVSNWIEAQDAQGPEDLAAALVALADAAPVFDPAQAPAAEPDPDTRTPVLLNLADVKPEPLRWLWPGRIPLGKVTLVFGDPGLGKSLVTLDVAARVSRGLAWPDAPLEPATVGGIILLSAEDDVKDTIRPRLDAAGADVTRIVALQGVEYGQGKRKGYFNLACDLPALEAAIRQTPETRLVIIDPISAYLGGADSHRNSEIRGLLAPLADLATRHGAAIVGVTHLNKGMGGRALYRATGSLAFVAAARAGWLVTADSADPKRRLFLPAKMNLAEEPLGLAYCLVPVTVDGIGPVPRLEWDSAPVTMTADEALAAEVTDGGGSALQEAVDFLRDSLAQGPVKANEVKGRAQAAGIAHRTLDRAKDRLKVEAGPDGFHGPWSWRLPGQSAPDSTECANT